MKFETVSELIKYLEQFNPDAEVLTDMTFSWSKPQSKYTTNSKLTTKILYVYGDYNPYCTELKKHYLLKDYIYNNLSDEYGIELVELSFNENGEAVYKLYYTKDYSLEEFARNYNRIVSEVLVYCIEHELNPNGLIISYHKSSHPYFLEKHL